MTDLVKGSGNVFADLGEPDAERLHRRAAIAAALIMVMDGLGLDKKALKDLRFVRTADLNRLSDSRLLELQHLLTGLEATRERQGG